MYGNTLLTSTGKQLGVHHLDSPKLFVLFVKAVENSSSVLHPDQLCGAEGGDCVMQ